MGKLGWLCKVCTNKLSVCFAGGRTWSRLRSRVAPCKGGTWAPGCPSDLWALSQVGKTILLVDLYLTSLGSLTEFPSHLSAGLRLPQEHFWSCNKSHVAWTPPSFQLWFCFLSLDSQGIYLVLGWTSEALRELLVALPTVPSGLQKQLWKLLWVGVSITIHIEMKLHLHCFVRVSIHRAEAELSNFFAVFRCWFTLWLKSGMNQMDVQVDNAPPGWVWQCRTGTGWHSLHFQLHKSSLHLHQTSTEES